MRIDTSADFDNFFPNPIITYFSRNATRQELLDFSLKDYFARNLWEISKIVFNCLSFFFFLLVVINYKNSHKIKRDMFLTVIFNKRNENVFFYFFKNLFKSNEENHFV